MDARQAWKSIVANLNRSAFDSSPFVITNREARAAHRTLMKAPDRVFLATVIKMSKGGSSSYLNRYISEIKEADGHWRSIKQFAAKLAKAHNNSKAVHRLVKNLSPRPWFEFSRGYCLLTEDDRKSFVRALGTGGNETWHTTSQDDDDDSTDPVMTVGILRLTAKSYAASLLNRWTSHANKIAWLSALAKALTFARLFLKPSGALGFGLVWGNAGPSGAGLYKKFASLLNDRSAALELIFKHDQPLFQRAYKFVTTP